MRTAPFNQRNQRRRVAFLAVFFAGARLVVFLAVRFAAFFAGARLVVFLAAVRFAVVRFRVDFFAADFLAVVLAATSSSKTRVSAIHGPVMAKRGKDEAISHVQRKQ